MKEAFRKLTLDQRDEVGELLDNPGWKSLVSLVEGLVLEQEEKLVKMSVADGVDKIVHQKLRAEGARALSVAFSQFPEHIRKLVKANS